MSSKRKADDKTVVGLNSVGLSLGRIAKDTGVHHTTVTYRLKELNIPPADTRRAFMEEIYDGLSLRQQTWLIEQLEGGRSIKDFVKSLIVKEFIAKNQ